VKHIFLSFFLFSGFSLCAQGVMTLQDKPFVFNRTVDSVLWKEINKEKYFKVLTQQDQWTFYWTNYFRQNPKRFYNLVIKEFIRQFPEANSAEVRSLEKDISKAPETLQLLYPEKGLLKMAATQSYDLEKRGAVISHISKTGKTFVERINEAGNYRCGAENIYIGSPDPLEALIALLIDMGVPDKGHRKNLLDPKFGKMGVSFLLISPKKGLLDQVFACP
jgi:hypothetical protein